MPRRVPPSCAPAADLLAAECDVETVTFNRPIPAQTKCHYCAELATTRDHIVPNAVRGVDAWWNLVPACEPCNSLKSSRQACACMFCVRAIALWGLGFRRHGMTRAEKRAVLREVS